MADLMYLIAFLNEVKEGSFELGDLDEAKHITVVPEFSAPNKQLDNIRFKFDRAAAWFGNFTINPIKENVFGAGDNPIPVVEIVGRDCLGNSIMDLHSTFTNIVYDEGGSCSSPQYCFGNFSPHISYMQMFSQPLNISSLALIHHRDGFGKNVVNLHNYSLNACS